MTEERVEPAGNDEAESGGKSVLHPGASRENGLAMRFGEACQGIGERIEVGENEVERGTKLQNEGSVEDVLTGGSPMDEAGGVRIFSGDEGGELLDKRDGEIAGRDGGMRESGKINPAGAAVRGDGLGGGGGDDSSAGSGEGESGLKIEHELDRRGIGENALEFLRAEELV